MTDRCGVCVCPVLESEDSLADSAFVVLCKKLKIDLMSQYYSGKDPEIAVAN